MPSFFESNLPWSGAHGGQVAGRPGQPAAWSRASGEVRACELQARGGVLRGNLPAFAVQRATRCGQVTRVCAPPARASCPESRPSSTLSTGSRGCVTPSYKLQLCFHRIWASGAAPCTNPTRSCTPSSYRDKAELVRRLLRESASLYLDPPPLEYTFDFCLKKTTSATVRCQNCKQNSEQ